MLTVHKRYAILIGVSSYEDEGISNLQYTGNDVFRLYEILQNHGGFHPDQIYVHIESIENSDIPNRKNPTRSNILRTIQHVADNAGPNDLILFFFAGHGGEISKVPYLLASDTQLNVLNETAISVDRINEIFRKSKAKCIIRFFDACRNGFGSVRGLADAMSRGFEESLLVRATGWASFSACASGEFSRETTEYSQGVFSYFLCEGLSGKAADNDGRVTIDRLVDYVKISVGNWADRQTVSQTPHYQSDLSGVLVMSSITIHTENQPTPPSPENPFLKLYTGIQRHISSTSDDVRMLDFTNDQEFSSGRDIVFNTLDSFIEQFSVGQIQIERSNFNNLSRLSENAMASFKQDLERTNTKGEFQGQTSAKVTFKSTNLVVPSTTLFITVGKFSFFYWLWYFHQCDPLPLQSGFITNPSQKKAFLTFSPKAIIDANKVEPKVREMFEWCSENILDWSNQLGKFLDERVDPLRKLGPIT